MPCTKTGSVGAESGLVFVVCETCLELGLCLDRGAEEDGPKRPGRVRSGPTSYKTGGFRVPGGSLRATKLGRLVVPNFGCAKWDPGPARSAIL